MGLLRRKWVRALAIVLGVLALTVLAVVVFLPTEKIRDLALAQAREKLGREVTMGDVGVSFGGGLGVSLADIVVHNPEGFAGDPLARVGAVDLKLAIGPLFKGQVEVKRLVLDSPRLNLINRADGTNNYTFAPAGSQAAAGNQTSPGPQSSTGPQTSAGGSEVSRPVRENGTSDQTGQTGQTNQATPAAITIDNFSLRHGILDFTSGQQTTTLSGIDGSLVLKTPTPGVLHLQGNLKADSTTLSTLPEAPDLPLDFAYELQWDDAARRLDIRTIQGSAAGFDLAGSGQVTVSDAGPTTALAVTARDLDLARILAVAAPLLPAGPQLTLAGRSDLDLAVGMGPGSDPATLSLKGQATVREGALAVTAGGQTTSLQQVSATAHLDGSGPAVFHFTGDLKAGNIGLSSLPAPLDLPLDLRYDMTWNNQSRTLAMTRVAGKAAQFDMSGSGRVQVADAGPTTNLSLEAADLDLAALWQTLRPLLPPEQKGELAGRAGATVELTMGPGGGLDALRYSGQAWLDDVSFTRTELVDELQELDARLSFDQDTYTITRSQARFASGSFTLTGSLRDPLPYFLPPELQGEGPVKTPHLEFALHTPDLDVDRLMPAASPSGQQAAANVSGPGSGSAGEPTPAGATRQLDMEFPDLTASGTLRADRLVYMQVPFTGITAQVTVADRELKISDVQGQVYQGAVTAQAAIDLKDLNNPGYSGQYQASQIEVNDFVTRFLGASGLVMGKTNMSGSFATHGLDPAVIRNSLSLNSDASLQDGRLVTRDVIRGSLAQLAQQTGHTIGGEQIISDLFTHIQVADGKVSLQDLKTGLGDWGELRFGGHYAFTGDLDYAGTLLLTAQQTDRLFSGGVLKELARLLGDQRPQRLAIPLTVGGTQTDPRVQLKLGATLDDLQKKAVDNQKNQLEDKAKEEVKKGLEGLLKKLK